MQLDLTALRNAATAHAAETQRLLEAATARATAATGVAKAFSEAQSEVDGIVTEIANQTAAIRSFNDANQTTPAS